VIRLLAFVVALSFTAALVPLGAASAKTAATMACCVGKQADHCPSGIKAKKTAAAPKHNHETDPSAPAFTTALKSCHSDCCACVASASRQQRREKAATASIARNVSPLVSLPSYENPASLFITNENWARISPRGPPAFLFRRSV